MTRTELQAQRGEQYVAVFLLVPCAWSTTGNRNYLCNIEHLTPKWRTELAYEI